MTRSANLFQPLVRALPALARLFHSFVAAHSELAAPDVVFPWPGPQSRPPRVRRHPWRRLAALLRLEELEIRILPTITNFQPVSSISVVEGVMAGYTIATFDDSDPNTTTDATSAARTPAATTALRDGGLQVAGIKACA
jgi:hypothetical protein